MKTKILTGALIAMMCFTACEKDDEVKPETPAPTPTPKNETASSNPVPDDAYGVLVAVNSKSGSGIFSVNIGTGVALFFEDSVLVSAGKVSVNSTELTRSAGNSYYSTPGFANPNGIDFSTDRDWTVEGGNGVPAISYNNNRSMPTVGENTSPENVSRSSSYTVSASAVSGADSVIFIVGSLSYTAAGNVTSHTFTADEIAENLVNGEAATMVVPYNMNARSYSNKKYYFINEAVTTKVVNVSE